ncbi:ROK family transcriptional regulator [Streptacidiphilus sp. P02-A3a]|uniref:ROK family transcriptional regulator n=1 Tax=Streptacidiphilus sp. P02-A3a TaxID=2704468 RepID=UPI0015FDD4B1|nr:ROK family transcriptional regulator [Streptacidiphilus sp. P02-A3a]QMU67885.1 ROK family transcriptional regulator [Streptacidiphilus sp. P02-A3a]
MATLPRDSRSERTRQNVVRLLRERGTLSRADIARATGMSRSTISGLISELVADDIVMELGTKLPPVGGRAGRPAAAVMLNPATGEAIGVDFGHRHVHVIIADVAHEVRIARSAELPPRYEPQQGLHAAAGLVQSAMDEIGTRRSRILGVGVSLPCTVDRRTGLPAARRYSPWSGVPVAAELGERLRMPVLVDSDANLGALAERQWGAGRDHEDLVYLKLHAGVSAAFISNGKLVRGVAGTAGEISHLVMDPGGQLCRCGRRGCLESYIGLPAVMRGLEHGYGDRVSLRNVITMAWQGDRGCQRALAEAGAMAGRVAGMLCGLLNPERVIVGGALAAAGELVLGPLREAVAAADPDAPPGSPPAGTTVTAAALGPQACALGAVALVLGQTGEPLPVAE